MTTLAPQTLLPEQTIDLIAAKAQALEEQQQPARFDIMLNRRDRAAGIPQNIASLTDATLEHIVNPMPWISMLCGGGEYTLNVRHRSTPGRLGGPIPFTCTTEGPGMAAHPPNPMATIRPDWNGPRLVSPPPPNPSILQNQQQQHTNGAMATGPVTTGYGMPSTPTFVQSGGPSDRERELSQQLADMRAIQARLEAESKAAAALDAVKRDADNRIREAEMRAVEARRESDQRMRDLEAKMGQIAAAPKETTSSWEKLVPLFMPLVQQMIQGQHETRQMMLKLNEDQNRRQLEANEKQHAQTMEFMRAATAQKPSGMSDEMKMLIETLKGQANQNGGEHMATLMSRMAEAMGTVTKSSIAMVETTVEALGGEPDHPAVIAIREGTQALKALMAGNQSAVAKTIKPQLPAGQQQRPPPPQQQRPNPANQLTREEIQMVNNHRIALQQQKARQAQPQPQPPAPAQQPQAAAVTQFPKQAPSDIPAQQAVPVVVEAQALVTPGFTAEGFPETAPGSGVSHFQTLVAGVAALKPIEQVAGYFIDLVKKDEPSMKVALDGAGGSPFRLLQSVLGQEFIEANFTEYFQPLGKLIDEKATEAGMWGEEEDTAQATVDDAADEAEAAEPAPEPVAG